MHDINVVNVEETLLLRVRFFPHFFAITPSPPLSSFESPRCLCKGGYYFAPREPSSRSVRVQSRFLSTEAAL